MIRKGSHVSVRRGAVVPLVALLLVFLIGMIAFAVDIGYIVLARNEAQNAADAGSLAGMTKLADRLKSAKLVNGVPQQTQADLDAARAEAQAFALQNRVANVGAAVKDAEVEFGYLGDPFNQSANTLDTTNWPARPYNAVRVTVKRDKDHTGGPLTLFFAPVLGVKESNIAATATSVIVMGSAKPKGNSSAYRGGLLPFTYQVDQWHALLGASGPGTLSVNGETITITDNYNVASNSTSAAGVTSGADQFLETRLFPDRTTSGNFGTINFTKDKSSNSTSVLRDLILDGPAAGEWPDLGDIRNATADAPVSVNGDPGLSAGLESAVETIVGQTRILPLYKTVSGTGNNTFYQLVEFVPVTIVAVDLHGGTKYITIQPRIAADRSLIDGTNRIDFDVTPSDSPNLLFLGGRVLVR